MLGLLLRRRNRTPGVAPVLDPDEVLTAMATHYLSDRIWQAVDAASALKGWLDHGGRAPGGYSPEHVRRLIEIVLGSPGFAPRRVLDGSRRVQWSDEPTKLSLVRSLCDEVAALGDAPGATDDRMIGLAAVLDALAEAVREDKLREFADAVERVKTELDIP